MLGPLWKAFSRIYPGRLVVKTEDGREKRGFVMYALDMDVRHDNLSTFTVRPASSLTQPWHPSGGDTIPRSPKRFSAASELSYCCRRAATHACLSRLACPKRAELVATCWNAFTATRARARRVQVPCRHMFALSSRVCPVVTRLPCSHAFAPSSRAARRSPGAAKARS